MRREKYLKLLNRITIKIIIIMIFFLSCEVYFAIKNINLFYKTY